ncbi:MAG: hypothetical protein GTO45_33405 [Candidatus Aminicenantes bacterium]|nr:hypothetical protein [Candidatus Aminicenantes bacterium]NIM83630.1 hypothetical protein [Candidatus Aminicenantes bacterium]NIN23033.1 hypothetical protein [Candidatus Aminicenantes bacterium]NIN46769.1 hypothetical protein [Candidatus Aminicenantes bacterium]NIN89682.1 hypothetical protein [Candidatus Aminicenantes bacterium]
MNMMKYTIGTSVPASEILRRYKDEDGEMFLEVRGLEDVLLRVTTGDRVYYTIDKSKISNEELTLIVDYTKIQRDNEPLDDFEVPTAVHQLITSEDDGDDSYDVTAEEEKKTEIQTVYGWNAPDLDASQEKKKELQEGQEVPEHLRPKCQPNNIGGYSLRYEKFLYLIDKDFRVEFKSPDLGLDHELEEDPMAPAQPLESKEVDTPAEMEHDFEPGIELEMGDVLPSHLRRRCEAEIGSNYGSRIILGNYLYLLDAYFRVTQKMRIAYADEEMNETSAALASAGSSPKKSEAQQPELPVQQVINNMVKTFETALEKYHISADYFRESVLGAANREILMKVYHGDLSELNDDTREAAAQGRTTVLKEDEAGFALFKAALVHELYIKTTVAGRGNNMKYFLTHIVAAKPDGTLGAQQDNIDEEAQEKMVKFYGERANIYTSKADIIKRIHRQVRRSIFKEYKELWLSKENVRFNALLISKLYEHTTRLDRGYGLTMMRISRDLMEYEG